jgi:hypothetical protein
MFAMSTFPVRFAAATAVAGTLFLAGCAGPDPAQLVEPVAPQRPPSMVADTGSCGDSATLGYRLCASQAQSKADRINALSDREYEQAQAAYEAAQKRYNAAVADAKKNPLERFMDRLGRAGFIGIGIIIAAVVCARSDAATDRRRAAKLTGAGRDPQGPAVQKIAMETAGFNAVMTIAAAAGAVVAAYGIGGVGGAVLAGVPAGLVAWGLVKRVGNLHGAEKGYVAAEADYQADVAAAEAEAAAEIRTPHADLGLGLDPVTPAARVVPEPILSREEALVYGRTGGVELTPGSAAAALIDRTGKDGPARRFWVQACEAAKLGTLSESRTFTPSVALLSVTPLASGDAVLTAKPDSITIGEMQLKGIVDPFIRAAGIRAAVGSWERDHVSGEWSITLSNRAPEKAKVTEEWV